MANTIDRLKAQLLKSGLQVKDQVLFQIINQLIDAISLVTDSTSSLTGGSGSGTLSQSFATVNNEQANLANSRQLYPGAGIQFNNQGQKLIISGAYPLPDFESPDFDANIPLPGIQGPIGPTGAAGSGVGGLTIPLPYEYDLSDIEVLLGVEGIINPGDGIWQSVPFAAGDFTASGGMTWGVAAGDVISFDYMSYKNTLFLAATLNATSITAPLSNQLFVKVPNAFIAASTNIFKCRLSDNGTERDDAIAFCVSGGTNITIQRASAINFLAAVNTTSVQFSLFFKKQ